jgi:hypothetical protein
MRVQCFARGRPGDWEAMCVDLDISVQGSSFEEVKALLDQAVAGFVRDAQEEDERNAARLLRRRAPFHVRWKLAFQYLIHTLTTSPEDDCRAGFDLYCPA